MIDGVDVRFEPEVAADKLGVLFDAPAYYPYLSARENLRVFATWAGVNGQAGIDALLDLVGLTNAKNRRVAGYSWGMKQRLGLASALLTDPRLVLLDEPTNGLDPSGIADVRRLLPKLAYEEGRTVFLSSHRMEEVEQICDKVIIIHQGAIVAAGTPAELAAREAEIIIRCTDLEAARRVLTGVAGITAMEQIGADRLKLVAPKTPAGKINQHLIENGVAVEEVVQRRESLEEVFFRLTGVTDRG
jgi:ABC-2 type transport system ATP-binding protein